MGSELTPSVGDVEDKSDAERIVSETIGTLGQVDILLNNAAAPTAPTGTGRGKSPRKPSTW